MVESRVFQRVYRGFQVCSNGLQEYFDNMSSIFHGCFIGVTRVYQGCFKGIARMLHFCFNVYSRVFQLCFEEVSRIIQVPGYFRGVLILFSGCIKRVSREF